MAKSIRQRAWNNFLANKTKLSKPGAQNIFVKKGYISVYPERILLAPQRELGTAGAPTPGNITAEVGSVNELDMADLEAKAKNRGSVGIFDFVSVVKMPRSGRRFYWVTNKNAKIGDDIEKSVRKWLNDNLLGTLSTGAGNNEDSASLSDRISQITPGSGGSTTLEHGSGGGVGEALDRVKKKTKNPYFNVSDEKLNDLASKETRGLKVQSNVLRSLKDAISSQGAYTDYAEAQILNWLDQEFALDTEMKKQTTVSGIEDLWIGSSTLTVRDKIPGSGTLANSPAVDNAVERRFREWADSKDFEESIAKETINIPGISIKGVEERFSASDTYQDRYMDIAVKNIGDFILTKAGRPDMRYKKNKEALVKLKARTQNKVTSKSKRKRAKTRTKQPTGSSTVGGGMRVATAATLGNSQRSALSLKELINAQLPGEILERMGLPALRNRTGRFRQSAEVLNVTQGSRGGTQIDYTYMRNPYETFEPGGAQGSTQRDPRRLIGRAVRDIAMDLTGKKFIKVRRL